MQLSNIRKVILTETIQFRVKGQPFIVPEGTALMVAERPMTGLDMDGNDLSGENPLTATYNGVRFSIRPEQFTIAIAA